MDSRFDHPLVERWFIILTPEPVADDDFPAGLPSDYGEVLYALPDGVRVMVQIQGWHCAGFEPSERRLVRVDAMTTWVWFDDEEEMLCEFEGTYQPRWELWAREQEWKWKRKAEARAAQPVAVQLAQPATAQAPRALSSVPQPQIGASSMTMDAETLKKRLKGGRDR
jgi:hypothetical protein